LFLFEFLKYFPGKREVYGAIVIPGIVMGLLFLMPIVGRWKLGHGFNVALVLALLGGAGR
jgi:ubiquinol-cytochrome c reductase cytochrome b subunit